MTDQTVPEIKFQIDRSKLTLGDMRFISKMTGNGKTYSGEDMGRMFDMLERVVVGGIEEIPFDALGDVMNALSEALNPDEKLKN